MFEWANYILKIWLIYFHKSIFSIEKDKGKGGSQLCSRIIRIIITTKIEHRKEQQEEKKQSVKCLYLVY